MFIYKRKVRLNDTDATGVLYFAEQFKMASEAFEELLKEKGVSLRDLLATSYLMPVVHAEGDYLKPVFVGDELEITLRVVYIGTSSVTLQCIFRNLENKIEVGKTEIVHVVVDREKRTSVPIPPFLRDILEKTLKTVSASSHSA